MGELTANVDAANVDAANGLSDASAKPEPFLDEKTVAAKFRCTSITKFARESLANLTTVYGINGENADFSKTTPSGQLQMGIDPGVPASDFFEPGEEYYLTFKKAPKG